MESKYALPAKPEDPNAEYLTVQETAYVFNCSVKTIRRIRKELQLGARVGSRILLSREDRHAMYEQRRSGPAPSIAHRRRRPAKKAAPTSAAKARAAA